jgi:quercetin dioxygenase-like cupin family protein
MFANNRFNVLPFVVLLAGLALFAFGPTSTLAQEGQPIDLPCVTGVTVQPLGQAMPGDANGQALVSLRLTVAPGGGFAAHTHPGTLIATIESGTFDLTQLDDSPMSITRGPESATPGANEPMTQGTPVTLNAGDWFVEMTGMVHTATNNGSEPTVILLSGLVDPSQPLVQCIEGTPAA